MFAFLTFFKGGKKFYDDNAAAIKADITGRPGQEFNLSRYRNGAWVDLHPGRDRDQDKMQVLAGSRIRVIPTGTGIFHLFNHFFRMYAIRMKTYSEYAMWVHCTYH